MKIYFFSDASWKIKLHGSAEEMTDTISEVASGTNTDGLVVSIYLVGQKSGSSGVAYVRNWLTPENFISRRGRWKISTKFPIPANLPEKFKLIRLQFSPNYLSYPLSQKDCYGWQLSYSSFMDHLAFLFSHELHHFRRHHLGYHHREGENSANKWALQHVQKLNFQVNGKKIKPQKGTKKPRRRLSNLIFDPYKKFRELTTGDKITIKFDPRGKYDNEIAAVLRPVRTNSRRIVIETNDGKHWRWPMEWVASGGE